MVSQCLHSTLQVGLYSGSTLILTAFPERDWAKYTSKDPMWKMPYLEVIFRGGRGVEQGKQM